MDLKLINISNTSSTCYMMAFAILFRYWIIRKSSTRSEEHTSELQSRENLVCRLQLEKKKKKDRLSITQGFRVTVFDIELDLAGLIVVSLRSALQHTATEVRRGDTNHAHYVDDVRPDSYT